MGGLSRKSAYIKTLNNSDINPIIIDAGDALFARINYPITQLPREQHKAKALLNGYENIGCDALNIGEYDLAGGFDFLKSLEENTKIPFISANLYDSSTGELAFDPYVVVKNNKLKVGIIGVTDYLSRNINELYKDDYLEAGKEYIKELRDDVDILVMLVNGKINEKDKILEEFKDADYIYLSRTAMNTRSVSPQKDGYPIFYTLGINGKQLVEVKSTIVDGNKPLADVSSSQTRISSIKQQLKRLTTTQGNQTLKEKYKSNPRVLDQIEALKGQVKELEQNLEDVVNKSEIKIISLPKDMEYDKEMQMFIDKSLSEALKK